MDDMTDHDELPDDYQARLKKAQAEHAAAVAAYDASYPNYCQSCDGRGGTTFYDSVPYGSTNVTMPGYEWCGECIGQGKCPRCGTLLQGEKDWFERGDDPAPCRECGWQDGDEGRPELDTPF